MKELIIIGVAFAGLYLYMKNEDMHQLPNADKIPTGSIVHPLTKPFNKWNIPTDFKSQPRIVSKFEGFTKPNFFWNHF